jgi:two-component system response regulator AtoC
MGKAKHSSGKNLPVTNAEAANAQTVSVVIHSEDTPELGERRFLFRSPAMRAIHDIATQVAGSDASVLIYGESGTGKELFARLLHTLSNRSGAPFVPVNCGILHGELFADKFFGHETGAFTGAQRQAKGAFETAGNGTLFLDEVGEIPPPNQVDFLRVLEERSFRRMGGDRDIPFRARIVAATNRPLPQMVREGRFRADLFYRLNVVPVRLPPLRERKEDILLLTEHCFELFRRRYHRHDLRLDPEVAALFERHPWPGNVRELRNLMERLVLLSPDGWITAKSLPFEMNLSLGETKSAATLDASTDAAEFSLESAMRHAEAKAIARALQHAKGRKAKTAALLGISERSLRYKMAEYRLAKLL